MESFLTARRAHVALGLGLLVLIACGKGPQADAESPTAPTSSEAQPTGGGERAALTPPPAEGAKPAPRAVEAGSLVAQVDALRLGDEPIYLLMSEDSIFATPADNAWKIPIEVGGLDGIVYHGVQHLLYRWSHKQTADGEDTTLTVFDLRAEGSPPMRLFNYPDGGPDFGASIGRLYPTSSHFYFGGGLVLEVKDGRVAIGVEQGVTRMTDESLPRLTELDKSGEAWLLAQWNRPEAPAWVDDGPRLPRVEALARAEMCEDPQACGVARALGVTGWRTVVARHAFNGRWVDTECYVYDPATDMVSDLSVADTGALRWLTFTELPKEEESVLWRPIMCDLPLDLTGKFVGYDNRVCSKEGCKAMPHTFVDFVLPGPKD